MSKDVFLSPLEPGVSETQIRSAFSEHGVYVGSLRVLQRTNDQTRFAFVGFINEVDFQKAIGLRKVKIGESLVNVREKKDRTEEDNRNNNTVNINAALRFAANFDLDISTLLEDSKGVPCTPCEDLYTGCCKEQHDVCPEIEFQVEGPRSLCVDSNTNLPPCDLEPEPLLTEPRLVTHQTPIPWDVVRTQLLASPHHSSVLTDVHYTPPRTVAVPSSPQKPKYADPRTRYDHLMTQSAVPPAVVQSTVNSAPVSAVGQSTNSALSSAEIDSTPLEVTPLTPPHVMEVAPPPRAYVSDLFSPRTVQPSEESLSTPPTPPPSPPPSIPPAYVESLFASTCTASDQSWIHPSRRQNVQPSNVPSLKLVSRKPPSAHYEEPYQPQPKPPPVPSVPTCGQFTVPTFNPPVNCKPTVKEMRDIREARLRKLMGVEEADSEVPTEQPVVVRPVVSVKPQPVSRFDEPYYFTHVSMKNRVSRPAPRQPQTTSNNRVVKPSQPAPIPAAPLQPVELQPAPIPAAPLQSVKLQPAPLHPTPPQAQNTQEVCEDLIQFDLSPVTVTAKPLASHIHNDLLFLDSIELQPTTPSSNGVIDFDLMDINSNPTPNGIGRSETVPIDRQPPVLVPVKPLSTSSPVVIPQAPDKTLAPITTVDALVRTTPSTNPVTIPVKTTAPMRTASSNIHAKHHTLLLTLITSAEQEFEKFCLSKSSVDYERFAELQNHISSISEIMPNDQQLTPAIVGMVNKVGTLEEDLSEMVKSLDGLEDEDTEIIEEVEDNMEKMEFEILICKGKILDQKLRLLL